MKTILTLALVCFTTLLFGQQTYPVNGSFDTRPGLFAFTNATIVVSANETISNGTLLIKGQTIQSAGKGITIPKGYVVIDLKVNLFTLLLLIPLPLMEFRNRQELEAQVDLADNLSLFLKKMDHIAGMKL